MLDTRKLRFTAVVLDWNLLYLMSRTEDIPPHYDCIVPEHVFHEIATTESGDPEGLIRKFGNWAKRNISRLWFPRNAEDLITRQWKSESERLRASGIINPLRTRLHRRFIMQPSPDWSHFLREVRVSPATHFRQQGINQLVNRVGTLTDAWNRSYPGRSLSSLENQIEMVRQPNVVKAFLHGPYKQRWRPEWTDRLATDPNQFALARWARFVTWYLMRRISGQTFKFENNIDDAIYGFIASFTGHLGTNDGGLRRAALAIFPNMQILRGSDFCRP